MDKKQLSWIFPDVKTFKEKKLFYLSAAIGLGVCTAFIGYQSDISIGSQIGAFLCVTSVLVSGAMLLLYYNPLREIEE